MVKRAVATRDELFAILETVMEIETESRFTLIYGNRTVESTMFREELAELESRYSDRLEVRHIRSRERNHVAERGSVVWS